MIEQVRDKNPDIAVLGQEATVPAGFVPFWYFHESAKRIKEFFLKQKVMRNLKL